MDHKYNHLYEVQNLLNKKFSLTAIIGIELEFYLSSNINLSLLSEQIGHDLKEERGKNQFEIEFEPNSNLIKLARDIENTRRNINYFASKQDGWANFSSKPYKNDFGSSMHLHLNFLEDKNIEKYANILCKNLDQYINFCLPSKEDYTRLDKKFMSPTHICWGGNNRTVMIRIPDSRPKRLEHRLPCANADPSILFFSLLNTIANSLINKEKIINLPKIWGNAFDKQYGLKKINYLI